MADGEKTSILKDWFTDSTGEGYSIGRALGALTAVVGLFVPVVAAVVLATGTPPTWEQFGGFLDKASGYILALGATVTGLILGTAPTDPGGRWWAKSNAPPPVAPTAPQAPAPE